MGMEADHRNCSKLSEMAPLVTEMLPNRVFVLVSLTNQPVSLPLLRVSQSSLCLVQESVKQ